MFRVVAVGDLGEAFGDGRSSSALDDTTETQQAVLEVAERNPDMKQTEIAEVAGCSDTTVSRTLGEYGDPAGEGRGPDNDDGGSNAVKWILLIAILLGVFALLGEGESGGAESLLVLAGISETWKRPPNG